MHFHILWLGGKNHQTSSVGLMHFPRMKQLSMMAWSHLTTLSHNWFSPIKEAWELRLKLDEVAGINFFFCFRVCRCCRLSLSSLLFTYRRWFLQWNWVDQIGMVHMWGVYNVFSGFSSNHILLHLCYCRFHMVFAKQQGWWNCLIDSEFWDLLLNRLPWFEKCAEFAF